MYPIMESTICYICSDRRRTADTDTALSKIGIRNDSETLKEVLLRALSLGHVEDNPNEEDPSRISYGVCVISLNSQFDGHLQALCNKVTDDVVIICKRCEKLLKDFEYHERTSAKIAKEIQSYLSRQNEAKEGLSDTTSTSSSAVSSHRKLNEKQSIQAALKALRRSGLTGIKKRGRKRKSEQSQQANADCTIKEESDMEQETSHNGEDPNVKHGENASRMSKRIQRRREEGLVIRWGDAVCEEENASLGISHDSGDDAESFDETVTNDDLLPRKRKGRKSSKLKFSKTVDSGMAQTPSELASLKYQCPFCQRYYVPSSSRIHNCTSYKNQLRCHICNIFFTSYIRLEKHLEVIHLKQRQLQCSEEGCKAAFISEPAFLLHKHFHFLSDKDSESEGVTCISEDANQGDHGGHSEGVGQVTVMDDDQGLVTSLDMADQVSFLLDEKSFLADGRPINIMTDGKRFAGEVKDLHKGMRILNSRVTDTQAKLGKIDERQNKTLSIQSISFTGSQCPFCDLTLDGPKCIESHIQDVHKLVIKSKQKDVKSLQIKDTSKDIHAKKNFNLISYQTETKGRVLKKNS